MNDCAHKDGTYTSSLTESMWGPTFGQFCKVCGACIGRPQIPARPEEAKAVREMDEAVSEHPIELDVEELGRKIAGDLEKWIGPDGPFRKGLTYWG